MFSSILNSIREAIGYIRNLIRKVIDGVLSFTRHIVAWFKHLTLDPKRHTPFIADSKSLKDVLGKAPRKDVGIFKGVYDEQRDEIVYHEQIEADAVDSQTKSILGNDSIVVLQ